jgi:hypothetical protein
LLTWLVLLGLWSLDWFRCRPAVGSQGATPVALGAPRLKLALRFALVVLLVAGLAAAQLLPFLDLAAHSQREQGYADTRWSMPSWGWANFLVPMVFGSVWNKGVFFQYDQAWTSSYYLGMGALLLSVVAVWTVSDRRVRVLAVAAGVALLLSFGDRFFVYRWVRHLVPQLSMMTYPVKFVLLISFAVPLLGAFALARLGEVAPEGSKRPCDHVVCVGLVLLALIAAIVVWAWGFPFPTDDVAATVRNGLGRAAFLVVVVIVLIAFGRARKPEVSQILALVLVGVFWLDVWTHAPQQNPTVPPWIYEAGLARTKLAMKPQPALGESRAMVRPGAEERFMRVITSDPKDNFLAKRLGYFADCNLLDGVPKVNGFFSLYPRECGELASVLYGSTNIYLECLADFMSVSQITAPGQFFEWSPRARFLPPVTGGQRPVYLDDTNAVLALLRPGFEARKAVILPEAARGLVTVTNLSTVRVRPERFAAQEVELTIEADEPALVVLSQTYYHCWRAYLDQQPIRLLRANYAFQAFETPAGRHRVRLVYQDRALQVGFSIAGLALGVCLVWWLIGRKKNEA